MINLKLKELVIKFQLSKDNTIIGNSRDRSKVRGIEDFELTKFDFILNYNRQLEIWKTMIKIVHNIIIV